MAGLTTEQLDETRRILAAADDYDNPEIHEARAVLTHRVPPLLDAIERLRAENQRLRDGLVHEARRCSVLRDEAKTAVRLMDGLAEQWGDEAVFRRCRDRLRAAVEAAQGAGA